MIFAIIYKIIIIFFIFTIFWIKSTLILFVMEEFSLLVNLWLSSSFNQLFQSFFYLFIFLIFFTDIIFVIIFLIDTIYFYKFYCVAKNLLLYSFIFIILLQFICHWEIITKRFFSAIMMIRYMWLFDCVH